MTLTVEVTRSYLPLLSRDLPSFGVSVYNEKIHIRLASSVPEDVVTPLLAYVTNYYENTPLNAADETTELLTFEVVRLFLLSLVSKGDLMFSAYKNTWRWFGEPCR